MELVKLKEVLNITNSQKNLLKLRQSNIDRVPYVFSVARGKFQSCALRQITIPYVLTLSKSQVIIILSLFIRLYTITIADTVLLNQEITQKLNA